MDRHNEGKITHLEGLPGREKFNKTKVIFLAEIYVVYVHKLCDITP